MKKLLTMCMCMFLLAAVSCNAWDSNKSDCCCCCGKMQSVKPGQVWMDDRNNAFLIKDVSYCCATYITLSMAPFYIKGYNDDKICNIDNFLETHKLFCEENCEKDFVEKSKSEIFDELSKLWAENKLYEECGTHDYEDMKKEYLYKNLVEARKKRN